MKKYQILMFFRHFYYRFLFFNLQMPNFSHPSHKIPLSRKFIMETPLGEISTTTATLTSSSTEFIPQQQENLQEFIEMTTIPSY